MVSILDVAYLLGRLLVTRDESFDGLFAWFVSSLGVTFALLYFFV